MSTQTPSDAEDPRYFHVVEDSDEYARWMAFRKADGGLTSVTAEQVPALVRTGRDVWSFGYGWGDIEPGEYTTITEDDLWAFGSGDEEDRSVVDSWGPFAVAEEVDPAMVVDHVAGLHDEEADTDCADCRALFDTPEEDTVTDPTAPAITVDPAVLDEYLRTIAEAATDLRVDLARVDLTEAAKRVESLIGFYARQGATVLTPGSRAAFRDLATGLSALTSPHHSANAR